jgi:serine protease DegQ
MVRLVSYILVFILGFTACAVIVNRLPPYQGSPRSAELGASLASYRPSTIPVGGGQFAVADAVARVKPAVVSIYTSGRSAARESGEQSWLRRWFSRPVPRPDETPVRGVASGVIVGSEGYILTNHHVVDEAERILVTLPDNRRFDGQVLGTDPEDDLAIVKIDGTHLPTAPMGDSARLRQGEWVIAIGNPLGFDSSVTVGVVSAERNGRPFPVEGKLLRHVIQTDAAINQGNSGGALVNLSGELIGINTAIVSTSAAGGSIGIGFAIPVNDARPVMKELIQYGRMLRPWIGIRYKPAGDGSEPEDPMDAPWQRGIGLGHVSATGVIVDKVQPGSPAEVAGIRKGDVIHRLDTMAVAGSEDVYAFMGKHTPGQLVRVVVKRKDHSLVMRLRLGQKPPDAGTLLRP